MKRLIKLLAAALCLTIVLSASLVGVFALSLNGISLGSKNDKATPDEAALYKDETVYVLAKADGSIDKIIVSDWIKNNKKTDMLKDVSALDDIENVKSEGAYTLDSDNMRVWQTGGEDLYLKGTGSAPLPVELSVTYFLDGKETAPNDLIGKSGKLTIRFDYKNNAYETVKINGKDERIYVPFLMMSGMILDSDKFSDVAVTNGKVISDGDRTIIAGIAFPGLQHDLGIKPTDIEIPSSFEVTAEAKDIELGTTITIATNGLTKDLDPDDLDSLDKLKDSMKDLESAMTALIDGSSQLYTGLDTLLQKSGELTDGIDRLYSGAEQLSTGADQVNSGASALSDGAASLNSGAITLDLGALDLSNGLSYLDSNSGALTAGSDMTFSAILSTAQKSLADAGITVPELTPSNYAQVLDTIIAQLSEDNVKAQADAAAREKVTAAVEANREAVTAAVTEAVKENVRAEVEAGVRAQVTAQVLSALGYNVEDYQNAVSAGLVDDTTQAQVNGAVDAQMASADVITTISTLTDQNMQSDTVKAAIAENTQTQINALIEQNLLSEDVQKEIAAGLEKAKAGRESVIALKAQLDSFNTFNEGLKTYTGGVGSASAGAQQIYGGTSQLKNGSAQLSQGASELKDGTKQLSDGAAALKDGVLTLKNGVPALTEGVSKLRDGSMQLSDGLKKLNDEGISKITSLLKDDLGDLAERIKATIKVSQNYKSYSGLTDEMDGEVKFIFKTEEIK